MYLHADKDVGEFRASPELRSHQHDTGGQITRLLKLTLVLHMQPANIDKPHGDYPNKYVHQHVNITTPVCITDTDELSHVLFQMLEFKLLRQLEPLVDGHSTPSTCLCLCSLCLWTG